MRLALQQHSPRIIFPPFSSAAIKRFQSSSRINTAPTSPISGTKSAAWRPAASVAPSPSLRPRKRTFTRRSKQGLRSELGLLACLLHVAAAGFVAGVGVLCVCAVNVRARKSPTNAPPQILQNLRREAPRPPAHVRSPTPNITTGSVH